MKCKMDQPATMLLSMQVNERTHERHKAKGQEAKTNPGLAGYSLHTDSRQDQLFILTIETETCSSH